MRRILATSLIFATIIITTYFSLFGPGTEHAANAASAVPQAKSG